MEIKRIKEKSIHDAIQKVREELGPDAVVLSTEKNRHGVEIIAALDFDASVLEQKLADQDQPATVVESQIVASEETLSQAIEKSIEKQFSEQMDKISETIVKFQIESNEDRNKIYDTLNQKIDTLHKSVEEKYIEQQRARTENFSVLQKQVTQLRDDFTDYMTSALPDEMNSIMQIHEEIGDLKDVLGCQTKLLDWAKWGKNNPSGISLISRLVNAGFGVGLSKNVMSNISDISNSETAWRNVIELLSTGIKTPAVDIQKDGGVVMALGRTGVGKTTTLAKIATKYVIENGPNDVVFINLDDKRVGSFDQLDTYGRILNVPVYRFDGEENTRSILKIIRSKALVLIDTAGMIEPGKEIESFVNNLTRNKVNIHKLLLMSANTQLHNLKEIVDGFKKCQPNGCVITKTDESSQLGNVITVSIEDDLPVYFETHGQQVPEDISNIEPSSLIQRAIDNNNDDNVLSSDDGLLLEGLNQHGSTD
ncbi:MAG: flagellar biosynthesis protein FlhF [Gammaproteobacteria bacterium]|nr:flagellar biosynthesis protein FlhF [Gammaproteobacteria bacterium]